MKTVIGFISKKTENKDGKPYMLGNASAVRVSILPKGTEEWYSKMVLGNDPSMVWQKDETVDIELSEKDGYKNWNHIGGRKSAHTATTTKADDSAILQRILEIVEETSRKVDNLAVLRVTPEKPKSAEEMPPDYPF